MKQQSKNRPHFIIIGGMKCATSTLHNQLNEHNSFFMTNPKEPNFFSDDDQFAKGIEWYESLFKGAAPGQLQGESSTHYTKLPNYPESVNRLAHFCPETKFIYVMRHPVDRLISHYIHEWSQGIISTDLNNAIEQFPELINYGRYAMQITPFIETFGSSAVLPLFTERLRDNPVRELERIFAFLGVDEKPAWNENIKSNVSSERLRACAWRDTVVHNNVITVLRRAIVPKKIRDMVKNIWTMKERPELSVEMLMHVESAFNKDLSKLGDLIGLELNCGNFKYKVTCGQPIEWCG